MRLKSESTAELCNRSRQACAQSRELVQEAKDMTTIAQAGAAALRNRMEAADRRRLLTSLQTRAPPPGGDA